MSFGSAYADRHLEMADELRDVLADRLPPAARVERAYAPTDDLSKLPAGKTVWLFPTTEEDAQRLSRAKLLTDYGFAVVTVERYEPAAKAEGEPVPKEWLDDFCGWVRENVYTPLNDSVRKAERLIATAWPQTCRLAVKYDMDRLAVKVAWSLVELTMREEREG